MGNLCSASHEYASNKKLGKEGDNEEITGEIHMLLCGIDYSCCPPPWGGPHALDTRFAFDFIDELARSSGVKTLVKLWNQEVNKQNVINKIAELGANLDDDDYFIFYYTGHGDELKDLDGDEKDGFDEAMCFLGLDGNAEPRDQVWMTDDELVDAITQHVSPEAKILVIGDCCHSGTLLDATKPEWNGFKVISMTGCEDKQTSAGTGKGGQFSRALTAAIQKLVDKGEDGFKLAKLYNSTLSEYKKRKQASHTQNIQLRSHGITPDQMVWPLQPAAGYVAPVNKGQ